MGHGYFMLRLDAAIQFKLASSSNKFELLVTSSRDRVFGQMAMAQQAEDRKKKEAAYRERKIAEKKKAAEEAKKNGGKDGADEKDGKKDGSKAGGEKDAARRSAEKDVADAEKEVAKAEAKKHDKQKRKVASHPGDTPLDNAAPGTPGSNVKVMDGEEINPPEDLVAVAGGNGHAVIAVPVKQGSNEKDGAKDHEMEVLAASPAEIVEDQKARHGEAREEKGKEGEKEEDGKKEKGEEKEQGEKEGEEEKKKGNRHGHHTKKRKNGSENDKDEPQAKDVDKHKAIPANHDKPEPKPNEAKPVKEEAFDPMRAAEMLAKMIQAGGVGPDGPLAMEDIKLAFKALERAADSAMSNNKPEMAKKKDTGPLMWTWGDSCERWRWRNYEAGCHLVAIGGWEERDWKVFADDRGCDEFDEDQELIEDEEEDVHDWSC